jgi:large subunit ribosomal protein L21
MAIAIIKTGGKQYKVQKGDRIDVERLDAAAGDNLVFDQVLFYANEKDIRIGDPTLEGASVSAKIVEQHRAKKVIAFKYKRRKGYHRTVGHRRQLTRVEIESIKV